MNKPPMLAVDNLKVHLPLGRSGLLRPAQMLRAVDGLSFSVLPGSSVGIVGESGSGKSTAAKAIMRAIPVTSGTIHLDGVDITRMEGTALRAMRHRFQMIFQDPASALNPRQRAAAIIREPLDLLDIGNARERNETVREMLTAVGLSGEAGHLFAHQFSGGQRQRLMIARALVSKPDIVLCDEAVSALDMAVQAQILNLLRRLQQDFGLTFVFISHNLGVVQYLCDYIAVMYLGRIVEYAPAVSLFSGPRHPYSWALMASAVPPGTFRAALKKRFAMSGEVPSPIHPPAGCRLAPRCPFSLPKCAQEEPLLQSQFFQSADGITHEHRAACHRATEIAAMGETLLARKARPAEDENANGGMFSI
ncbi:MAG: ABC transporter ATP-binding protein [Candidatus Accumulibacter sp.]|jgi:peptide/nickel transport system ATP-binding protein|nr:ABC transporter ATP-binding protein [Accumulibacter sp.]